MPKPSLVILAAGRARRYGGLKQLAPVGVHGEAVIDLIASDAFAAGFERVVIVVNPDTGPEIEEHVRRVWPLDRMISFAVQEKALGTVPAVLAAEKYLDASIPFGVSNADDLYGRDALAQLGAHLANKSTCCLIGFQLDRALVGDLPVSRGVCHVVNGHLTDIWERRQVHATEDGFVSDDGESPVFLAPETTVSMNLWGFQPSMWPLLHKEMDTHDFEREPESQLPVMVGKILHHVPLRFDVIATESRCVGVTHADDLPLVQADVRLQVSLGERPEHAFR
ncbi:MAG TPA: sugar phosphate nucleotidyltransferase [Acidimicrobiales bacterium]